MLTSATLFRFLNEFIVLLLGTLLIVLAISGHVGLPGRPSALVVAGIVLIYWGVRALMWRGSGTEKLQARVRAGSLVLVGFLVLGIPLLPTRQAEVLLEIAGGVLVLRGILGSILVVRRREQPARPPEGA